MKLDDSAKAHFEYLQKLGFPKSTIEHMRNDNDAVPNYAMSLFMEHAWSYVVDSKLESGWLENTRARLHDERDTGSEPNLELSAHGDEEWKSLAAAVKAIQASGVAEEHILKLVRASQICLLGYMLKVVDGATGLPSQMFESRFEDGNFVATKEFYSLYDTLWDYNPDNIDAVEMFKQKY